MKSRDDDAKVPMPRSVGLAAGVAALTSILFLTVYGICNAVTAGRQEVGTWYFEWELTIPLVPWLILPYMSIDIFFVVAPFVCTTRQEVLRLGKRLAACILVAGACFLLWPLRLAFERPAVDGWLGPVFALLHGFDQPFNLFPSLHVALAFTLRWTYHRHLRGYGALAFHVWFALITASTVFTLQHHVIDLAGGLVLALCAFYVFPTQATAGETARSERSAYLAARLRRHALLCFAIAGFGGVFLSPWLWWFAWPATAIAIVAQAYAAIGPSVFRKHGGRLSFPAKVVLAPYLIGLWLTRRHYWRNLRKPMAQVMPQLWIGRRPDEAMARELFDKGVQAVLDLTAEHDERHSLRSLGDNYHNVPMLDLVPPSAASLDAAVSWLQTKIDEGRQVYVHCGLGLERSGTVATAYLLRAGLAHTTSEAVNLVRRAQPQLVFRSDSWSLLESWQQLSSFRSSATASP